MEKYYKGEIRKEDDRDFRCGGYSWRGEIGMREVIILWEMIEDKVMIVEEMGWEVYRMMVGKREKDSIMEKDEIYIEEIMIMINLGIRKGRIIYLEEEIIIEIMGLVEKVEM